MNLSRIWRKASLLAIALGLMSPCAMAQQTSATIAPAPPELQVLEEGEAPAVTIEQPGSKQGHNGNSITERRDHGQTKEIKVQSGPSTYYLKSGQIGNAVPGDVQSGPPIGAQWKIKEFDAGGKKKSEKDDTNK